MAGKRRIGLLLSLLLLLSGGAWASRPVGPPEAPAGPGLYAEDLACLFAQEDTDDLPESERNEAEQHKQFADVMTLLTILGEDPRLQALHTRYSRSLFTKNGLKQAALTLGKTAVGAIPGVGLGMAYGDWVGEFSWLGARARTHGNLLANAIATVMESQCHANGRRFFIGMALFVALAAAGPAATALGGTASMGVQPLLTGVGATGQLVAEAVVKKAVNTLAASAAQLGLEEGLDLLHADRSRPLLVGPKLQQLNQSWILALLHYLFIEGGGLSEAQRLEEASLATDWYEPYRRAARVMLGQPPVWVECVAGKPCNNFGTREFKAENITNFLDEFFEEARKTRHDAAALLAVIEKHKSRMPAHNWVHEFIRNFRH